MERRAQQNIYINYRTVRAILSVIFLKAVINFQQRRKTYRRRETFETATNIRVSYRWDRPSKIDFDKDSPFYRKMQSRNPTLKSREMLYEFQDFDVRAQRPENLISNLILPVRILKRCWSQSRRSTPGAICPSRGPVVCSEKIVLNFCIQEYIHVSLFLFLKDNVIKKLFSFNWACELNTKGSIDSYRVPFSKDPCPEIERFNFLQWVARGSGFFVFFSEIF